MSGYRLGDVVRCKRCRQTFEVTLCGRCDVHHPVYVDLPVGFVVDHAAEFCSTCVTPEEQWLHTYHEHQRKQHGELPN